MCHGLLPWFEGHVSNNTVLAENSNESTSAALPMSTAPATSPRRASDQELVLNFCFGGSGYEVHDSDSTASPLVCFPRALGKIAGTTTRLWRDGRCQGPHFSDSCRKMPAIHALNQSCEKLERPAVSEQSLAQLLSTYEPVSHTACQDVDVKMLQNAVAYTG